MGFEVAIAAINPLLGGRLFINVVFFLVGLVLGEHGRVDEL